MPSGSLTSRTSGRAPAPISSTARCPRPGSREPTYTVRPSAASSRAICLPMPLLAPVTRAVRSFMAATLPRSQAPGQGQSVPGGGGQEAVWRGRSWPTTCGTAGRPCVRTRSACRRRAPPAAHRACAAKRWRSSPTCRSTTTRGWSRPGDRGRRPGSWTRWPARCGSRRPSAATCSAWRVRAHRPAPPPCGGCARTWSGCWTGCRRPVPSSPTRRTTSSRGTPWPRHCSAATSETGRRTWPAAASSAGGGRTRAPPVRSSDTSRWRGCAGPPTATRTTRGWPPCWPNCTTAVRSSGRSGRPVRSTRPGTARRPWSIRRPVPSG